MNTIADGRGPQLELAQVEREIVARDRELDNRYSKDLQLITIANARSYRPDGLAGSPSRTSCSIPSTGR